MKIAVFGDLIQDIFLQGTCERLNPEGPSPLIQHQKTIRKIGGAGNVVENLKSLGISVDFFHPQTPPSRKTRIIADGVTICRFDEDVISPPLQINAEQLDYNLAIISDYNKGALNDCRGLIQDLHCKVFVDPKKEFENYYGAFCIKPNKIEFEKYYGKVTQENLKWFAKKNHHELVIVTLGKDGLVYYFEDQVYTIPAISEEVADVTGAGDCFLAAMIYAITKGKNIHEAIQIGNLGAGVSVKHQGTYVLQIQDLIQTKVFTNG